MSKVIAVANQKGGLGKTVTSVNLGIGLMTMKENVLKQYMIQIMNLITVLTRMKKAMKNISV